MTGRRKLFPFYIGVAVIGLMAGNALAQQQGEAAAPAPTAPPAAAAAPAPAPTAAPAPAPTAAPAPAPTAAPAPTPAPTASAAPPPPPSVAPTAAVPAQPSAAEEGRELLKALEALKERRAQLDARAAAQAAGRHPATPEAQAAVAELEASLPGLEHEIAMMKWRAQVAEHFKGQIQANPTASHPVPQSVLTVAPAVMQASRANHAYMAPSLESEDVGSVAANGAVYKVADLKGQDWILVWLPDATRYAYLPAGAARALD